MEETKKPDQMQKRAIEERVEKMIKVKKNNPSLDTSGLEQQIDELEYKIYGLTPDEIAIVGGEILSNYSHSVGF